MLYQIITHTPTWVFALFIGLLWFGLKQTRASSPSLARSIVMPLAMMALSLYGTVSAFAGHPISLLGWLLAAALLAWTTQRIALPPATRFDPVLQRFTLAGSWVPLGLMMGIFMTKYAVGVTLAMHPALAQSQDFAMLIGTLYGAFSGIFCGRAVRLLRLALHPQTDTGGRLAA